MNRRQFFVGISSVGTTIFTLASTITSAANARDDASRPQKLEFRTDESTGVKVADIRIGNAAESSLSSTNTRVVEPDSKINIHITGRLLGRSGWIFENSQQDGEPYRMQLGKNGIVPGLESGLLGMAEGGIRRIVVPSEQGYLNKQLEPIPRDFGDRQRLYTTVMNSIRVDQERSQLGTDLAGRVVFDVELLRIR